ncbi:MAG: alpha-galactosidase [Candidatus Sumerlaeia bacterium]
MLNIQKLAEKIADGQLIPISLFADNRPVSFECTGKRETTDGFIVSLQAKEIPLTIALKGNYEAANDLLRFQAHLYARDNITKPIDHVKILDLNVDHADINEPTWLRTFTAGAVKCYSHDLFPPCLFRVEDILMRGHDLKRLWDFTGRGSNQYMPLWFYYYPDRDGFWFAPEWQGSWDLLVHRLPEYTNLGLQLQYMHFDMHQGEEISLPPMVLSGYKGSIEDGSNHLRRVLKDSYLPDIGDKRPEPLMAYQVLGSHPNYLAGESLYREADLAEKIGCETFTFASMWQYDADPSKGLEESADTSSHWWEMMGDYTPGDRFGENIKDFSDYLTQRGMRLGLWYDHRLGLQAESLPKARDVLLEFDPVFEQEVRKHNNPLSYDINVNPTVDLSREAGRQYVLDTLERLVTEYGARFIWYDYNTNPRTFYFDCNEASNRRGLLELKFYQGLDQVMAEFRRRHPDVWVEFCASGGRMLNIAILRYSHSLWITDYTGSDCDQAFAIRTGANLLFPAVYNHQSYYMRKDTKEKKLPVAPEDMLAHFAGSCGVSQGLVLDTDEQIAGLIEMAGLFKQVRHYLEGDYYMLLPQATDKNAWEACQFHLPEKGEGIAIILRLEESETREGKIKLRGIGDQAPAQIEILSGDAKCEARGNELILEFAEGCRATLIKYAS